MRELKFRAWVTSYTSFAQMAEVIAMLPGSLLLKGDHGSGSADRANCYLMQYIDRKDKNGVEIYEGDILSDGAVVQWFNNLTWDSGGSSHPGFYCKKWTDYDDEELSYHYSFDDVEVIGNIYENPELLEQAG